MAIDIDSNSIIRAVNPATMQFIGEVRVTPIDEIHAAVAAARAASKAWRAIPLSMRLQRIEQFRQLLFESRENIAKVITSESGKPRVESLVAEVFGVLETCDWLKKNAERILSPERVNLNPIFFPGKRSYNVFEPVGVVAVISPWNYPFSIPVSTIVAALVAGNAVVFKPSPKTALVAQCAVDLLRRAGFPDDLVALVQGDRLEAQTLIESDINRIMFTGSVNGGKAINTMAARKLLPITLELGGKHPAIVLRDSDIEKIARPLTWAAFTNAGQACASVERLYVEEPLVEKLTQRIVELTKQLRLGDGMLPDTDVGPVLDEPSLQRIQDQVDEAVSKGARVLAGGKSRKDLGGYFFEPTVLVDVRPDMRVLKEEIFGPVLPIVTVPNVETAITLANDSCLGLGASIWTADVERGERLARDVEAGMVWINDGLYTHIAADAPWGGIKESGIGRMHSAIELRDLVYVKNVGVNSQRSFEWNFPYKQLTLDYVRGGIELIHGNGSTDKLHGLRKIISFLLGKRDE